MIVASEAPQNKEKVIAMRQMQFIALLFASTAIAASAQTLASVDAKKHVGEQAIVCGMVVSERTAIHSRGAPTFIDIDAAFPKSPFTIVIWGENRSKVGSLPAIGSGVCASGRIQEYRGAPQMVVRNAEQLTVPRLSQFWEHL